MRTRVLLAEAAALGVTIEDLVAESSGSPDGPSVAPTVAEYVKTAAASFSKGTAGTHKSYWRLAAIGLGGRPIDAIGVDDFESVVADAVERARRNIRFHLESGARREGALNLRLRDLDLRRSTVWLRRGGPRFNRHDHHPGEVV
jgi:integrase